MLSTPTTSIARHPETRPNLPSPYHPLPVQKRNTGCGFWCGTVCTRRIDYGQTSAESQGSERVQLGRRAAVGAAAAGTDAPAHTRPPRGRPVPSGAGAPPGEAGGRGQPAGGPRRGSGAPVAAVRLRLSNRAAAVPGLSPAVERGQRLLGCSHEPVHLGRSLLQRAHPLDLCEHLRELGRDDASELPNLPGPISGCLHVVHAPVHPLFFQPVSPDSLRPRTPILT